MELAKQLFEYGFAVGAAFVGLGLAVVLGMLLLGFLWEMRPW